MATIFGSDPPTVAMQPSVPRPPSPLPGTIVDPAFTSDWLLRGQTWPPATKGRYSLLSSACIRARAHLAPARSRGRQVSRAMGRVFDQVPRQLSAALPSQHLLNPAQLGAL